MDVRFKGRAECQAKVFNRLKIAFVRFQNGIDQNGLPGLVAPDEVGVGARLGLEQLLKNHMFVLRLRFHQVPKAPQGIEEPRAFDD